MKDQMVEKKEKDEIKLIKFTVSQQARGSCPDGHASLSLCWSRRDSLQHYYQTCPGHMAECLILQLFLQRTEESIGIQSRLQFISHKVAA